MPDAYRLVPVVEKRGIVIFTSGPNVDGEIPNATIRRAIDKKLTEYAHEHLIVFHDDSWKHQIWQYTDREPGKPLRPRTVEMRPGQSGEAVRQLLDRLWFEPEADEEEVTLVDVLHRIKSGIPADAVTKKFYREFSKQRDTFEKFIEGIEAQGDRDWYASIMLNRLMFIWFVQAKGFLDNDPNYLVHRFNTVTRRHPGDGAAFMSFYRAFLRKLFHEGLDTPKELRDPEIVELIGNVPYLNGGIFDRHELERANEIDIPDKAFADLFTFFGQYQWHLDNRPLRNDREINPDVIGYIFEQFVNQKEKGAYYTKEDVTGYISQNTILPWVLDRARRDCAIAFRHTEADNVWILLQRDPLRYVYPSMKHGVIDPDGNVFDMPEAVAPGIDDISQRGNWNERAAEPYALPTETWREYVHRRSRTLELRARLASGEVREVDDLITYNLDIRQFAQDIVEQTNDPVVLRAMYKAIANITVLDPTCGSGAFLFAALEILHPLHDACLDKMAEIVADLPADADPKRMQDFRGYLAQMRQHPNKDYYVQRQIVLNNLYGVDIEEEAVEICKIRLFLSLVAKLDKASEIEPLPDIDFNIRAGNTLVGYVTEKDIQIATGAGQMSMDLDQKVADIRERVELADKAYQHFKRVQQDDKAAVADLPMAKAEYRRRLQELRNELDGYLHRQQAPGERRILWKVRTQPFHWFVEFHGAVVDNGGFDAIIGNPPYVRARDVRKQYALAGFKTDSCPDIYAMIMERSLELLAPRGSIGLIVPLSLSFSDGFENARKLLRQAGPSWFSSYDILPAPLFTGAAQRCTIYLGTKRLGSATNVTRMHRWRAANRASLFDQIDYTSLPDDWACSKDLPRHYGKVSVSALEKVEATSKQPRIRFDPDLKRSADRLGYAKAALNFVSVFLENPPLLDSTSLEPRQSKRIGSIAMQSSETGDAALASTVGELYLWYWLTRGDGFDVTGWVLSDFLVALNALPADHCRMLAMIGRLLYERRNEALAFKHHAGQYVGNYNYRGFHRLTRRGDLVLLHGLGVSRESSLNLLDFMQRTLLVNENAGEKGIPDHLREMFPRERTAIEQQHSVLEVVDTFLLQSFDLSEGELECILATGYPQWPSVAD